MKILMSGSLGAVGRGFSHELHELIFTTRKDANLNKRHEVV